MLKHFHVIRQVREDGRWEAVMVTGDRDKADEEAKQRQGRVLLCFSGQCKEGKVTSGSHS